LFSESAETDRSHLVVPSARKGRHDMNNSRLIIEAIGKKLHDDRQEPVNGETEADKIEEE